VLDAIKNPEVFDGVEESLTRSSSSITIDMSENLQEMEIKETNSEEEESLEIEFELTEEELMRILDTETSDYSVNFLNDAYKSGALTAS
jgi:hypothetical protein